MRNYKILNRGINNDFYLVEEEDEYHILEIYDDLEIGDIIIEIDSSKYLCNDEEIFAIMQYEYIDLQKAIDVLQDVE